MPSKDQPNILLIMMDQLNTSVLPMFAPGGRAITPHLSRLADQGVVFDACYCNSPLCAPSRASFVTSRQISANRVYDNGAELSASFPTFLHHLRMEGYETVLSGKMHFVGPDQLHGFERRLTTDIYPSDFVWTTDWSRNPEPLMGTTVQRLDISGVCGTNNQMLYDEEVQFRARDYLRNRALGENDRPFFLCASYTHPHDPFMITQDYWDLYDDVDIPDPIPGPSDLADHHQYNQWIQICHDVHQHPPSQELVRKARRGYHGMVSYLDALVGDLTAELGRLNLLDNTIIMFTSDHGEMLGNHGMWFKRTFYEGSARVPLIVSCPERFSPRRAPEVVSLIDIGATVIELAGGDPAPYIATTEGESFAALLEGPQVSWKNQACMEYCGEGTKAPMVMARKDHLKYAFALGCDPVLFDLEKDPNEQVNLALQPAYGGVVKDLHDLATGGRSLDQLAAAVVRNQQDRLILRSALGMGQKKPWDFEPTFDASKQYVRGKNLPRWV